MLSIEVQMYVIKADNFHYLRACMNESFKSALTAVKAVSSQKRWPEKFVVAVPACHNDPRKWLTVYVIIQPAKPFVGTGFLIE